MKVDKGYNQIKKFQRIEEAQKLAMSSSESKSDIDSNWVLYRKRDRDS